jgi:hypothetical protein
MAQRPSEWAEPEPSQHEPSDGGGRAEQSRRRWCVSDGELAAAGAMAPALPSRAAGAAPGGSGEGGRWEGGSARAGGS